MTCERIRNELIAYRDGELSERDRTRVAAHLSTCPTCTQEAVQLERVGQMVASLERITPSPDFAATFWQRLEQEGRVEEKEYWLVRWWHEWRESFTPWQMVPALAGAASIMVFLGYVLSGSPTTRTSPSVSPAQKSPGSGVAASQIKRDIPAQLTEEADFFANYKIIEDLERFANFEQIAALDTAAEQNTEVAESKLPSELLENPSFFAQYPILQRMDKLKNLEAVLTLPSEDEQSQG